MNAKLATVVVSLLGLACAAALGVTPAAAATVTPPDMKMLVPTNLISVGLDATSGHRMLRYTHITEDAGTGPFELDPSYNAATGISSFVQTIYSSSSPGVWTVDHTVPLAVNAAFVNGSHYRFPLTKFTLNTVNADGSVGFHSGDESENGLLHDGRLPGGGRAEHADADDASGEQLQRPDPAAGLECRLG